MRVLSISLIAVILGGCASERPHHDEHVPSLALTQLPTAIQAHFLRDHSSSNISWIEKQDNSGVIHYQIEFTQGGQSQVTWYNREGDELKE